MLLRFGAVIGGGFIALAVAMPARGAQTEAPGRHAPAPSGRSDGTITVTGCLLLGPYGDYIVTKTIAAPGSIRNAVAWKLEGPRELLGHVLEEVEVTGTMTRTLPGAPKGVGIAGADRPAARVEAPSYRLRVDTIRKVVGACS